MKKTKMRLLGWLIEVKKTSFGCYLILTFLAVLIELYYRLSMALAPKPKPIALAEVSLVGNWPIKNELSYFKAFGRFDGTLL